MAKSSRRRGGGQLGLEFPNGWGGRRKGAGPKPRGDRAGVSHRTRHALASRFPVHVTMRVVGGLPSLRGHREHRVLVAAFREGCERGGSRLVHYSVQSNHIHLLVEARNRIVLSRGLQGLAIRVARGLNRLWRRVGGVLADRYHDHILRTPREVWNALRYVLCNARKHGGWHAPSKPDPCSSGRWFDGWRERPATIAPGAPTAIARTWLLGRGWRRHGRLSLDDQPAT